MTGKAGAYSIGALDIQTDAKPSANAVSTNFSVVRIKRDILPAQQRRPHGDEPGADGGW